MKRFGTRKASSPVLLILTILSLSCGKKAYRETSEEIQRNSSLAAVSNVVLTMGSWRTEDVEQMNAVLAEFHKTHPSIHIKYDPTINTEYNAVLEAQLEHQGGPDIFYLRSFAASRSLFEEGYLEALDSLPGLKENFAPDSLKPWTSREGRIYGVPFIATSHAIYYNAGIFSGLGIEKPDTWESLLAAAERIRKAGYIPVANATGDAWTAAEILFMNIAPSFMGGRESRTAYLEGGKPFDSPEIISVFAALRDLAPFLPPDEDELKYLDSLNLFSQGRAAMWFGGSWDIPYLEANAKGMQWSVFAVPAPRGGRSAVSFHPDAGMGLSSASAHKDKARVFLEWMTTMDFADLLGTRLPGFFPMRSEAPALENIHAKEFLRLNEGREKDIRFTWERLMDGSPSAYDLIRDGSVGVIEGTISPRQAAENLRKGLAKWYSRENY